MAQKASGEQSPHQTAGQSEHFITSFLKQESASGLILMAVTVLALLAANTPLAVYYELLIDTPVRVQIGALDIYKPLLLWVNDGLMAIFFFLVGLELKRELLEGELADRSAIVLPVIGAIGGMAAPALVYYIFNRSDTAALQGWAIPAATDIAFALGILSLLGSRVPTTLKIFLTSLAIFDDIGAIVIIAFFYTSGLSLVSLFIALGCFAGLILLNLKGVGVRSLYLALGLVMWTALLKSGVHATLAGILLAAAIPLKPATGETQSMLREMEHDLHYVVAFLILPIFAFCNAGIPLVGLGVEDILHPVPLGIALGLLVGKQVGIFGLCWLAVKAGAAKLPEGMTMGTLYGVAALCGVGFTMSLFIGSLAFEETGVNLLFDDRLGILTGSFLSGVTGYFILRKVLSNRTASANK